MKARKKPVVISCWPVVELLELAKDGFTHLPDEVRAAYLEGKIDFEPEYIAVATMEGIMQAGPGWMLIQGVAGEWYPCEDEIFHRTYDVIEEGQ